MVGIQYLTTVRERAKVIVEYFHGCFQHQKLTKLDDVVGKKRNIYKEGRRSEIGTAISLPRAPLVTGIVHVSRLGVAVTAVLLH